jgi:hypothetical protein
MSNSYLHDLEFGVILDSEQIDVRRFLLADSPLLQPGAQRFFPFSVSNFGFRISFSRGIFHGYII